MPSMYKSGEISDMQKTHMRTHSGQEIWYLEPRRTKIVEEDVYWGLKNQCRYGGQNDVSILAHTALGLDLCDLHGQTILEKALFAQHDQHEALVLDIPQGLKECLPDYNRLIENSWEEYFHTEAGFEWPLTEDQVKAVKFIDIRCLVVEMWIAGWGTWNPALVVARAFGGPPTEAELAIGRHHLTGDMTDEFRWTNVKSAVKAFTGR